MIKLIQTGRQVHSVIDLMDKYIVKFYTSREVAINEASGLMVFRQISPNSSPKIVFRLGRLIIFNKLKSSEVDKSQICDGLAGVISQLSQTTVEDNSQWRAYLDQISQQFFDQKSIFQSQLKDKDIYLIEDVLNYLNSIDWDSFPIQPLHRDLHLGNLIHTNSGVKIIDFEHFCYGPLEYEFSNSLLFADKSSLNINQIAQKLHSYGVFFNLNLALMLTVVYFIEQFSKSCHKNDLIKQKILAEKFITLTKTSAIFGSLSLSSKCLTDN